MGEADGIDDAVDGGPRQALMTASRPAETLARLRREALRGRVREAAERATAQGALAAVPQEQWRGKAQPDDIARVYGLAESWKDHDPAALAASERIRTEVQARYRIDTRGIGTDAAYLESDIKTAGAAAEHHKGMVLIAAAQA